MNTKAVILVMGLPGSGKTTLSDMLASKLNAARINADYVREAINTDLGFSMPDRREHARRMAKMCGLALTGRNTSVVIDFVCPTLATRCDFEAAVDTSYQVFKVWMNTIDKGRFADTNAIWENPGIATPAGPGFVDIAIEGWLDESGFVAAVDSIVQRVDMAVYGATRRGYFLRYNTKSDAADRGDELARWKWRLFETDTGEERLIQSFMIHSSTLNPLQSFEMKEGVQIPKWNIAVTGIAKFSDCTTAGDQGFVDFY